MKFVMPDDPETQIGVFSVMLERVEKAIETVPTSRAQLEEALKLAQERGDIPKLRDIFLKKLELRGQELSLIDQRRRLEERIEDVRKRLEI